MFLFVFALAAADHEAAELLANDAQHLLKLIQIGSHLIFEYFCLIYGQTAFQKVLKTYLSLLRLLAKIIDDFFVNGGGKDFSQLL